MTSVPAPTRSLRLAPAEVAWLAIVVFGWAIMVVARGKDMSWDFRNYHWYIPYAFLHGRLGFDIAVAHQATYYNPLLDTPFYLLATGLHAWLALGILGAIQGANIVPLYFLCRSLLRVEPRRLVAAILSLFSMLGSLTLYLAGATYYDNVMSVLVLSALAVVIAQRETLRSGNARQNALVATLGGILLGAAVGLKLPEAPFAAGFVAALAVLPGNAENRIARVAGAIAGGLLGFAIFEGYWMAEMLRLTGNPIFPYFNQYFHSPLALSAPYRDLRFIPRTLEHQLLFPLLFSIDWRVADDLPFSDIRVGIAYVLLIATFPVWVIAKRRDAPLVVSESAAALFTFVAVSYAIWLRMFAIYRYIVILEMLSPLVISAAIALWPVSPRTRILVAAAVLMWAQASSKPLEPEPYVQAAIPPIPRPDRTMILMTGEAPLGYLVPSLPKQVAILRIDGWLIQPQDGSRLTRDARKRVDSFHGDLFAIADAGEIPRSRDALSVYGLAMITAECRNIETNLGGPYRFCPLTRVQNGKS
jgi:hypothetical protein